MPLRPGTVHPHARVVARGRARRPLHQRGRPAGRADVRPGRRHVDGPGVDRRAAVDVPVLVVRAHLEGVVTLREVAELLGRRAGCEIAAVEAALELGVRPRRAELEPRVAGAHERRRGRLDLRLRRVHVRIALGRADHHAPAEQRAGVVLVAVAHAELPCALLLLAVEPRQLICLWAEAAGVRGGCRAGADHRRRLVVEHGVDEVVATVVGAAYVLDQPDGRGVVGARELDLEVAHEAVVDAVDADVEVLDPAAHRHVQVRGHATGVVVRDRERLGLGVGRRRARPPGRDRYRHGLRPTLGAGHVEHAGGVHAAGGAGREHALEVVEFCCSESAVMSG